MAVRRQMVKECGQDMMCIRLARVYNAETTICAKAFITYIRLTTPASNFLASDVFESGIFHRHFVP